MGNQTSEKNMLKVKAHAMMEGAGANVKRLFPTQLMNTYDPFVLLDEFFVTPPAGFPTHPHRGFEGLTYMLEGGFNHKDNLGNDSSVYAGGVQRFTAGLGLEHSELPAEEGVNHGFQLWINLEKSKKGMNPSYQQVDKGDFPVNGGDGIREIVIAGEGSSLILQTEVIYKDVTSENGAPYEITLPKDHKGFIYVFDGAISVPYHSVEKGEALFFSDQEKFTITSNPMCRFLFISGRPHGQEMILNGPFVD